MCEKDCSGHCLNNAVCDYINGKCSDGCQPGYIGKLCNDCKIFKSFFHYVRVNSLMNDYVSNKYTFYSTACRNGYYGQNCSRLCSPNCKTCKPTDGRCSCYAGWMGPNCSIGIFGTSQYMITFKMNV